MLQPEGRSLQGWRFSNHKKGKSLLIESSVEAAITKEYATDAANPNFRIIIRNNLDEVEAAHYDQVGEYYNDKKNWNAIGDAYERAVALVPYEFKYLRNLAFAYEKQNRWSDAVHYYERCIQTDTGKENARVHGALGAAYARTGHDNKAITELEKALTFSLDMNLTEELRKRLDILRARTKNE